MGMMPLARTLLPALIVAAFLASRPVATADDPEKSEAGLGFMHPLKVDGSVITHCPHPQTVQARLHTYVIFVNGVDPGNLGNFHGLFLFVKAHGYPQSYFGQMTHGNHFLKKIRQIHCDDPQARFVLVGFSGGTYVVRNLANTVKNEGIVIDLLAYVGGDMIYNNALSQPDNALRILNVTGHGFCLTGGNLFFNGDNLDRATNVRIPIRHFALPSHHDTIEALMGELAAVVCSPMVMPPTPASVPAHEVLQTYP
jgi:hypothetical protein